MCWISQFEKANSYAEGEGAAVAQICRDQIIENNNCLIVSNDGDALLYAILAGMQRTRTKEGKFASQVWVQLLSLQQKTSVYGIQKGKASEFGDINALIYCIEAKLKTLDSELTNPVYDMSVCI